MTGTYFNQYVHQARFDNFDCTNYIYTTIILRHLHFKWILYKNVVFNIM